MKEKKGFGGFWKKLSGSRELSLVAVLVLLCAVIQLRNNTFLTAKTIADLLKNYSTTITISLGMMSVARQKLNLLHERQTFPCQFGFLCD